MSCLGNIDWALLQAYFDDGKKSIKSDWGGFFFSENIFLGNTEWLSFSLSDLWEKAGCWTDSVACWAFVCDVSSSPWGQWDMLSYKYGQRSDHTWKIWGILLWCIAFVKSCRAPVRSEIHDQTPRSVLTFSACNRFIGWRIESSLTAFTLLFF